MDEIGPADLAPHYITYRCLRIGAKLWQKSVSDDPVFQGLASAIVGLEVSPTVSVPLARLPVRC